MYRTNANENGHKMVSGMCNKNTRSQNLDIVTGIVATAVYIKNEGRRQFYKHFLQELNLTVGETQHNALQRIQKKQLYTSQYAKKDYVIKKRAKQKTKYQEYLDRAEKAKKAEQTYQLKHSYKSDCNINYMKNKNKNNKRMINIETICSNNAKRRKIKK